MVINITLLQVEALELPVGITRIDSLMRAINRWGGPIGGDSCGGNTPYESSIYHLAELDSTAWEVCENFDGILAKPLVRFNNIIIQNIFGQSREVMQFDFGGATGYGDTIWHYGASLAKGIGVIEDRYFEGEFNILQGAIINGVKYGTIVSVEEIAGSTPNKINLYQNYPNPFNPTTTIRYEISNLSNISLIIYDVLGKEIYRMIDDKEYNAGKYSVVWNGLRKDGSKAASGIYFYRLITDKQALSRSMILLK